jgi:uracil-DNA glycosylase
MNPARRKKYLQALGIPVWQARQGGAETEFCVAESAVDEEPEAVPVAHPAMSKKPAAGKPGLPPVANVSNLDWQALASMVRDCQACGLRAGCTQTVFGVGSRQASLLVVGEGPGADEDRVGEPFVGRAGKLLDSMLLAIGRDRADASADRGVYIGNIVKCRPPNNRDPQPDEAAACRPYLERQITLIQPKLILAVGRIAAQNLLQTDTPISKLRGPVHYYGPDQIPVIVTYHPAYLLRSPRENARAWEDLKRARALLREAA